DDEIPLVGKEAHAAREARSPLVQLGWLFAVALIGFATTSAAMWFGPGAVEYLREAASRFADPAPKSTPKTVPHPKPVWFSGNPIVIQPPSIPQFSIPHGHGFATPSRGGGASFSRFSIPR